jgi:octaprenyl-diphosphate synthase
MFRFGEYIGIAFQMADDTLDYTADGASLGKTLGQDLREGKITLPLLHLLQHCPESDRQMIKDRLETRTLSETDLRRIIALMQDYGSIAHAMDRAQAYVAAATRSLPQLEDSPAKRALVIVADYMVNRDR